jgi:hypothetical protein
MLLLLQTASASVGLKILFITYHIFFNWVHKLSRDLFTYTDKSYLFLLSFLGYLYFSTFHFHGMYMNIYMLQWIL